MSASNNDRDRVEEPENLAAETETNLRSSPECQQFQHILSSILDGMQTQFDKLLPQTEYMNIWVFNLPNLLQKLNTNTGRDAHQAAQEIDESVLRAKEDALKRQHALEVERMNVHNAARRALDFLMVTDGTSS